MSSSEFQSVSAETLRAWDNEHVWHPFTPMSAYVQEQSPIIARGEGFDLIDVEGHRYLDGSFFEKVLLGTPTCLAFA